MIYTFGVWSNGERIGELVTDERTSLVNQFTVRQAVDRARSLAVIIWEGRLRPGDGVTLEKAEEYLRCLDRE